MVTLPGFDIEHEVARFDGHRVYRVIRQSDHKRLLLKTIGDADRQGATESLRAESLNFQRLEVEGLARVTQVTEVEGEIALLFEDRGGQPLDQLLSLGPLEPIQVLRYARALAFTLAGLHRHGFMHRDIRPCHIWVNRETGLVELTGLGQASQVPREWHALGLWGRVTGRLAYMSPEQTGRVNRAEDYRTDFYSLGATLFEMMTGRVPFETADPLALVHAHMAQPVVSASDVNPAVPEVLSDIVRRLMAKEPADRYQGGLGLQRDLDLCLGELESTGEVRPFEIGQRDPPARFELPQGLYGREAERARLVHGLDEASRAGVSMLLVSGDPGVGKTALVEELRQEVLRRHGLYAYGKYREGQREIPYSGLFEALRKMVDQLLAVEPSEIETYRTELSAALGEKLGVMVDLLPGLQAIVSDVPPVHTLGPAESKARFQLSLTQFLGFLTARDRSVALVLDDLQWVDAVSLELIEHCLEANVGNLLLVGTYRANEVDDVHPLSTTVSRLRKQGARLEEITVRPLDLEHVRSFVADTFRAETMETERLAQIVYDATAGNPLDTRLFVRALHRDGLVRLLPTGGWTWRESATGAASGGKPVSDLADHSLTQLPEAARRTLSLAAALGDPFPVQALAAVCEQTVASTESALIDGCRLGILSKEDKIYRFAHDRFRETAYRLISHKHRHQAHLKIGRLLSRHATRDELTSDVFGIVRHLNLAEAIVTDRTERDVASRMNLDAGRKAKVSGGFASAFQYFSKGLAFLAEDSWSSAYDLTLALTCETAEAAFLMGQFAEANRLVAAAIEGATTVLDKVRAYETKIAVAHAQGKEKEALGHAFEILEQLGLHLPHDPTRDEAVELATTASLTIEPLLSTEPAELRLMTDPSMGAAMRVLARAIVVAGWSNYDLLVAIESTFVKLTVEHGHAPESVLAYVGIADWRCRYLGDYEGGRRAGERGLALVPVLGAEIYQAHGDFLFTLGVTSWLEDEHRVGEDLATAYMGARRAGNLIASSSGLFRCHAGFYSGVRLEKVEKLIAEYHAQALGAGHERVVAELDRLQEQIKRFTLPRVTGTRHGPRPLLRDRASDRQRLASRSPAIMSKLAVARGQVTVHLANLCHDMMAHVLWRRSEEAYRIARHAPSPSESPPRGLTPYSFWLGLSLLDGCSKLGGEDKEAVVATTDALQERLRSRARTCPSAYQHRADLVDAQRLRVDGEADGARALYDKSIEGAHQNGYAHEEALANELAAEHELELGRPFAATGYLRAARAAYERWGAGARVTQLIDTYATLLGAVSVTPVASTGGQVGGTSVAPLRVKLDVESLSRASTALASELDLDRLVAKLMTILVQDAGAERGVLLRVTDGRLTVAASASTTEGGVEVDLGGDASVRDGYSAAIVRYVLRSRESVTVGDVVGDDRFASDPYVARVRPKSVLSTPIVQRGDILAVLYLENNQIHNAFAKDRLKAVEHIAADAAAALANARLHDELKRAFAEIKGLKDQLETENVYLRDEARQLRQHGDIVGDSESIQAVLRDAEQVAPTDSSVLILGETGTGKELLAEHIHSLSDRGTRPMITVNCAALPTALVESELFGREKGAFTGALSRQIGRFELADGSTLFLDEVGDLPTETQVKLLRVLQSGQFERLGSTRTLKADVRVIAATNRDLTEAMREGTFREDLYYRLAVFPMTVPPLRERPDDIPLLVWKFVQEFATRQGKHIDSVPRRAMEVLQAYPWPGNVRELGNFIERAVILTTGPTLQVQPPDNASSTTAPALTMDDVQRRHILEVLGRTQGRIRGSGGAAEILGMKTSTLYDRMNKLGIERPRK